jgi:acetoacetyl-CoA reductase
VTQRIAIVTGGLGAIGIATCVALSQSGHTVIAADLHAADQLQQASVDALKASSIAYEQADVSSGASCEALIARVKQKYGQVDVLVNNAGITRDGVLKKMLPEEWDVVLAVNLSSVFNLCRHVAEDMSQRGYGRIVNISSIIGQTGQFGQANYAAAKAGMHGFTMSLARELGRKGVTVNSISPGYIKSAMTDAVPQELRDQVLQQVPVGRIGQAQDIAHAVAFLCKEESSYITGINLPVNGGLFMSF